MAAIGRCKTARASLAEEQKRHQELQSVHGQLKKVHSALLLQLAVCRLQLLVPLMLLCKACMRHLASLLCCASVWHSSRGCLLQWHHARLEGDLLQAHLQAVHDAAAVTEQLPERLPGAAAHHPAVHLQLGKRSACRDDDLGLSVRTVCGGNMHK